MLGSTLVIVLRPVFWGFGSISHIFFVQVNCGPLRSPVQGQIGEVCTVDTSGNCTLMLHVCVNQGESRNLTDKVATCASLLGSPPLGNDTHGGSTFNQGVREEAGKRFGKTSFRSVLRIMPKRSHLKNASVRAGEARRHSCQELVACSGKPAAKRSLKRSQAVNISVFLGGVPLSFVCE